MDQQQFLQQLYPHLGGYANVGRWQARGGELYITVKDRSMVDLESIRSVPGVAGGPAGPQPPVHHCQHPVSGGVTHG